ncbi:hypothetical protein B0H14DRAFT_3446786 [Mycena olivaceomarginata]|nr:hypothetical protein B0H14DRAFT_3446786 [Mycena olivaceomarginata]
MAHNPQAKSKQLSSLTEWSMQHIRDVFEAPSDELSLRAIHSTFSRNLKANLNGAALDFDELCGLVSAMRKSARNGLDVQWARADDAPDDLGNRSANTAFAASGESNPGSDQLFEFERRKKVVVRIQSQSAQPELDSRLIMKLDIVASDVQVQSSATC